MALSSASILIPPEQAEGAQCMYVPCLAAREVVKAVDVASGWLIMMLKATVLGRIYVRLSMTRNDLFALQVYFLTLNSSVTDIKDDLPCYITILSSFCCQCTCILSLYIREFGITWLYNIPNLVMVLPSMPVILPLLSNGTNLNGSLTNVQALVKFEIRPTL